jgi:hypothetical protein
MATVINMQPQELDLKLYAGDGFTFRLICTDSAGYPVDVNGSVMAQIRRDRLTPEDPPLESFAVVLTDAYLGIVVLSLTGDQTQALSDDDGVSGRFTGVWDLEWDPAESEPRTLCQGTVECVADVTR